MRLIFMGTPDFALPTLDALVAAGHEVVAAYTQPPRPAGRGQRPRPSPVQARAEALGIAVRHPASLHGADELVRFAALEADAAIVIAYGLILGSAMLEAPRLGCINVHGSLLARWRGAAPIQRAILAGDEHTGVTIMQMAPGLDTGAILARSATLVGAKTAGELHDELALMGASLLACVLADLPAHPPVPQDEGAATYAAKITKQETRLDFAKPAPVLEREVRAFAPAPGSWLMLEGERIRLLRAEVVAGDGVPGTLIDDRFTIACGQGALRPVMLQRAGRPAMPLGEFLRGRAVRAGDMLA